MSYYVLSKHQQLKNLKRYCLCKRRSDEIDLTVDTLIRYEQISCFVRTFMNELLSENHFTFWYSIAKFSYFMSIIHNTITFWWFTTKLLIVLANSFSLSQCVIPLLICLHCWTYSWWFLCSIMWPTNENKFIGITINIHMVGIFLLRALRFRMPFIRWWIWQDGSD